MLARRAGGDEATEVYLHAAVDQLAAAVAIANRPGKELKQGSQRLAPRRRGHDKNMLRSRPLRRTAAEFIPKGRAVVRGELWKIRPPRHVEMEHGAVALEADLHHLVTAEAQGAATG